jgi:hypothetical protein
VESVRHRCDQGCDLTRRSVNGLDLGRVDRRAERQLATLELSESPMLRFVAAVDPRPECVGLQGEVAPVDAGASELMISPK